MAWLQLSIDITHEQVETFSNLLEDEGACAITLTDAADQPLLEPAPGETPLWSDVRLTALFEDDVDTREQLARLCVQLAAMLNLKHAIELEEVADQQWERAWMQNLQPLRYGQNLWVCPGDMTPPVAEISPQTCLLHLDPGLAFGTGHHATTALCLTWLDSAELKQKRILDFGCGSGILAIAALLLGASSAVGIDHDPQALIASESNARVNAVRDRLTVGDHVPSTTSPFDCVLANILAQPLIDLAPQLISLLQPDGDLVLSGLLREQVEKVMAAYQPHIEFATPQYQDEWVMLYGQRIS